MKKNDQFWRRASEVFDQRAAEYDQWFDNSLLYQIELAALRALNAPLAEPKFEIGVGPGRFAGELGVRFGLDPADGPLRIAKVRGIEVCRGVGEALPLLDKCIGTLYLLFALCFMADPRQVLQECRRVLVDNGKLVLGLINRNSVWGAMLDTKKRDGHPFYKYATFFEPETVVDMLGGAGFTVVEACSSLLQPPECLHDPEPAQPGIVPGSGFIVLVACFDG